MVAEAFALQHEHREIGDRANREDDQQWPFEDLAAIEHRPDDAEGEKGKGGQVDHQLPKRATIDQVGLRQLGHDDREIGGQQQHGARPEADEHHGRQHKLGCKQRAEAAGIERRSRSRDQ